MDEAKKRAFRKAVLGRLVIKKVGLPAAMIKAERYAVERGRFEVLVHEHDSAGAIVRSEKRDSDRAIVRTVDGQAIERTYADVGREVCSLIELARGWTPTKPTRATVVEAADKMEKAAKDLAEKIIAFERLHGWIKPPKGEQNDSPTSSWFKSQIGIPHEEMLAFLESFVSVNTPQIRLQAMGNDPKNPGMLVGYEQLIGKIWALEFEGLFGQEATEGLVNDTINGGYRGPFIRFGRFIADCAELEGVSDDMLYSYPMRVKRKERALKTR